MKRSINYTKQEKPFVRRIRCDIYGVNGVNLSFHFAQYKSKGMSQKMFEKNVLAFRNTYLQWVTINYYQDLIQTNLKIVAIKDLNDQLLHITLYLALRVSVVQIQGQFIRNIFLQPRNE